jgi:hypothetical protein
MWADILYNVILTGLCEGLKLNLNLDLLKDLRRIFGVGFIDDVKNFFYKDAIKNQHSEHKIPPIDGNLLFSNNRIAYTIVKSFPHIFCLSYVTIRLSLAFGLLVHKKVVSRYSLNFNVTKTKNFGEKSYAYYEKDFIIDQKLNRNYNLVYTRNSTKTNEFFSKFVNIYSKIVVQKENDDQNLQTYLFRKYPSSFEDRYVKCNKNNI